MPFSHLAPVAVERQVLAWLAHESTPATRRAVLARLSSAHFSATCRAELYDVLREHHSTRYDPDAERLRCSRVREALSICDASYSPGSAVLPEYLRILDEARDRRELRARLRTALEALDEGDAVEMVMGSLR